MKLLTTTDLSLSLFTAALQLVSLGKRPSGCGSGVSDNNYRPQRLASPSERAGRTLHRFGAR